MKSSSFYWSILLIFGSLQAVANDPANDLDERKKRIEEMEAKVSSFAADRRNRSEDILKKVGVPINKTLPQIEDETNALVRTKEEVVNRALVLLIVAVKGEGLEQEIVESLFQEYALENFLSPKEKVFIKNTNPSEHDKIQFLWRYEAAWTLLWSLGYVDELSLPTQIFDVPAAITFMQKRTKEQFINDAKLRSISDILNENDLIYRYHWAVVDARLKGDSLADIDTSVVLERHYTLNWLIGYMEQKWDDISTDT